MGGAYVAKPDVATVRPVPDGWDVNWTFPPVLNQGGTNGVFCPDYEVDYSLGLEGDDELPVGEDGPNDYEATLTLYDHVSYETAEPPQLIYWTAYLDGVPLRLKFAGGEFAYTLASEYEAFDGLYIGDYFWGDDPTIVFDVDSSDDEKTITLIAESNPFDWEELFDTLYITVVTPTALSVVAYVIVDGYELPGAPFYAVTMRLHAQIKRDGSLVYRDYPRILCYGLNPLDPSEELWSAGGGDGTEFDGIPELSCTAVATQAGAKRIDITGTFNSDSSYNFSFFANEGGGASLTYTMVAVVTFDDGHTETGTRTETIEPWGDNGGAILSVSTLLRTVYWSSWDSVVSG